MTQVVLLLLNEIPCTELKIDYFFLSPLEGSAKYHMLNMLFFCYSGCTLGIDYVMH